MATVLAFAPRPAAADDAASANAAVANGVNGATAPSIARAQMVFWTAVIAGLFVLKSALEGRLWDVPSEMVALMGVSQVGYLAPKFATGAVKQQQPA